MSKGRKLKIVSVSAEVSPFSKTGGLADVASALPKSLSALGHQVQIITPFYAFIRNQNLKIEEVGKDSINIGQKKFKVKFRRTFITPILPVYFIYNKELFNRNKIYGYPDDNLRFMFFNLACLKLINKLDLKPDIIHCHDWHSGLIPNYLKRQSQPKAMRNKMATVFTIHNMPFQFALDWWKIPKIHQDDGRGLPPTSLYKIKYINFTKRAIINADVINAVSERYAHEILTPEYGQGLEKYLQARSKDVYGIINGIDYTVFNPSFDKNIYFKYDWNSLDRKKKNKLALQKEVHLEKKPDTPLIGLVHRLSEQKGFDLLLEIIHHIMKLTLQIVVVGSGTREYIKKFKELAKKYPKKIALVTPFSEKMGARVYAGSDMFLMPSRYEPCGISQLISLRYGSIPIVHETGGLSDTITNYNPRTKQGNGFTFSPYGREGLLMAIVRALENYKYNKNWLYLAYLAMRKSYSWEIPAKKYISLYFRALRNKRARNK